MIEAKNISKSFKLYGRPADRLKEIILRKKFHRKFQALNDVSFYVGEGETLGIVGQNGAGKTTLLKILTKVFLPDSGVINVNGRTTGLLELGTGFNPEFTGIQNIFFNGTLLGMSKDEISAKLDDIKAFSELGDFLNESIKTYSSGMVMRLAFSVAIHADPKAFVVDEALSVGDAYFQQKCMRKIREFKKEGGSIVFVSHDMNAVKVLCDKAILLERGEIIEEGDAYRITNTYNFMIARKTKGTEIQFAESSQEKMSYGNYRVEILHTRMLNFHNGVESEIFVSGEPCMVEITIKAYEAVMDVTVGILIRDRFGQDVFGTNSFHYRTPISMQKDDIFLVEYFIDELNLGPGRYTLTTAAHKGETHVAECFHWADATRAFEVVNGEGFQFIGISRLDPTVRVMPRC